MTSVVSNDRTKKPIRSYESSDVVQKRVSSSHVPSPKDFMFGKVLGEGAYAKVVHARMKKSGKDFAAKVMDKSFIKKHGKIESVARESKLLRSFKHQNIMPCF